MARDPLSRERQRITLLATLERQGPLKIRERQERARLTLLHTLETTREQRRQARNARWLSKIEATSFVELSPESQRTIVCRDQQGACNHCKLTEWRGHPIILELEHRDGDRTNNTRENLEAICPNCHSLTATWRGRNKTKKVTDSDMLNALSSNTSIRQALVQLGLAPKGGNYARAKRLLSGFKEKGPGRDRTDDDVG